MPELTHDRPKPPRLPKPGHVLACALELSIVGVLVAHHSIAGLALCAAYAWFSATWCILSPPVD